MILLEQFYPPFLVVCAGLLRVRQPNTKKVSLSRSDRIDFILMQWLTSTQIVTRPHHQSGVSSGCSVKFQR